MFVSDRTPGSLLELFVVCLFLFVCLLFVLGFFLGGVCVCFCVFCGFFLFVGVVLFCFNMGEENYLRRQYDRY